MKKDFVCQENFDHKMWGAAPMTATECQDLPDNQKSHAHSDSVALLMNTVKPQCREVSDDYGSIGALASLLHSCMDPS